MPLPATEGDKMSKDTCVSASGQSIFRPTPPTSGQIRKSVRFNLLKEPICRHNDSGYFTPSPGLLNRSSGSSVESSPCSGSDVSYPGVTPSVSIQRRRVVSVIDEDPEEIKTTAAARLIAFDRLMPHRRPDLQPKRPAVALSETACTRFSGRKYVDFVRRLHEHNLHTVTAGILGELQPRDLGAASCVSRTWRRVCYADKKNNQRRRLHVHKMRHDQENLTRNSQERPAQPLLANRSPFKSLTETTNHLIPPPSIAPHVLFNNNVHSENFKMLLEIEPTLKPDDKLHKCPRCSSPAKVFQQLRHAVCSRRSCAFDFCTDCRCGFVNHSPCSPYQPRMPLAPANPVQTKWRMRRLLV